MLRARLTSAPRPAAPAVRPASLAEVDLDALRATVALDHAVADPAHDIGHLDRVAALAAWLARQVGVDPKLARIAAYVHEYHRVLEARTGVRPLPADAADDLVRAVLDRHRVPAGYHAEVLSAVATTGRERLAGDELPEDLLRVCPVAAVVHDADNLDAMGVVGLARAVGYGALLGEPLWRPDADIRATYTEGRTSSVLAHCYEKLVHLADEMLTEPGRQLARRRLADLLAALGRLRAELAPAAPGAPGRAATWDPHTGYLRLALDGGDGLGADCRVAFTADARVGLRAHGGDPAVCYLELFEAPAVASAAVATVAGASRRGGRLRIPVRSSVPDRIVAGAATVELELSGDRLTGITLHLAGPAGAARRLPTAG